MVLYRSVNCKFLQFSGGRVECLTLCGVCLRLEYSPRASADDRFDADMSYNLPQGRARTRPERT